MCVGENLERKREREFAQKSAPKMPKIFFYFFLVEIWGSEGLNKGLAHFSRLNGHFLYVKLTRRPLYVCRFGYADINNFVFFPLDFDSIFEGIAGL